MPKARARVRHPRPARPARSTKPRAPSKAASPGPVPFEDALRDVFRDELSGPVSQLAARLLRFADGLAGGLPRTSAPARVQAPPPEPLAPPPPACAVIGCKLPRGSLGYCVIHAQRRRQMIASQRLHAEWVENAAPHSVPDVIPPRKRRGERQRDEDQSPAEAARPVAEPRMFVRKKGQAEAVIPTRKGAGSSSNPAAPVAPPQTEQDQIVSTVGRWASEFKARKSPH